MIARLLPILGITFIDIIGFSILIPILPYYVKHFDAPDVVVGLLFASFAAAQFLSGPVWGHISDRIGRKRVLIVSQVGATLGWTLLAVAPTLGWVFVARILEGASGGNISVTQAYVADRVPPEQRARAFSYVGATFSAGLVLGPAAGGTLLQHFGYAMPFLVAAALQILTLVATIFFLPESVAERGESEPSASLGDIGRFLREPAVSPILVQKLAYSLGLYGWFSSFALVLQALVGFGPTQCSYFFAAFGVMSVFFQLAVVGNTTERLGARRSSNVGLAAGVAFFVLIALVHSVPALLAVTVLFSLSLSLTNATLASLLTNAAPEHVRGTILGVGSSLESLSGVIMPGISTAVLAAYGPPWTAGISAAFCGLALALGLIAQRTASLAPAK